MTSVTVMRKASLSQKLKSVVRKILKHSNIEFAEKLFNGAATKAALKVAELTVQLARSENSKLSSFHFLYGVLSYADSSASALLQLNGCDLHRTKRLLLECERPKEPEFNDAFPMSSCTQDVRNFLDISRTFADPLRNLAIHTAHMLLALYQPEVSSSSFLQTVTPSPQVIKDLERLIRNQQMGHED